MPDRSLDYFGPSLKTKRAYWQQWIATATSTAAIVAMNAIYLKIAAADRSFEANYIEARVPAANEAMAVLLLLLVPWLWVRTSRLVVLAHLLLSVVLPYFAAVMVPIWIDEMGRYAAG